MSFLGWYNEIHRDDVEQRLVIDLQRLKTAYDAGGAEKDERIAELEAELKVKNTLIAEWDVGIAKLKTIEEREVITNKKIEELKVRIAQLKLSAPTLHPASEHPKDEDGKMSLRNVTLYYEYGGLHSILGWWSITEGGWQYYASINNAGCTPWDNKNGELIGWMEIPELPKELKVDEDETAWGEWNKDYKNEVNIVVQHHKDIFMAGRESMKIDKKTKQK